MNYHNVAFPAVDTNRPVAIFICMATNITFDSPRSLSPMPGAKPGVATTAAPRYWSAIVAAWERLAAPAQLSSTGRAFHHAFRALPVPR
jgi:hypothetical protein